MRRRGRVARHGAVLLTGGGPVRAPFEEGEVPVVDETLARKRPRSRPPRPRGPRRCPSCGARDVLKLVFGYPSPGLLEDAKGGEVALGGCVIDKPSRWRCGACGHQW